MGCATLLTHTAYSTTCLYRYLFAICLQPLFSLGLCFCFTGVGSRALPVARCAVTVGGDLPYKALPPHCYYTQPTDNYSLLTPSALPTRRPACSPVPRRRRAYTHAFIPFNSRTTLAADGLFSVTPPTWFSLPDVFCCTCILIQCASRTCCHYLSQRPGLRALATLFAAVATRSPDHSASLQPEQLSGGWDSCLLAGAPATTASPWHAATTLDALCCHTPPHHTPHTQQGHSALFSVA